MQVSKANNHSMIVWYRKTYHSELIFVIFEINQLKEGKHYQIRAEFNQTIKN